MDKEIQEFMDEKYRLFRILASREKMWGDDSSDWIFHISYEVLKRLRADFTHPLYLDTKEPKYWRYGNIKLYPDETLKGLSCEIYQKRG